VVRVTSVLALWAIDIVPRPRNLTHATFGPRHHPFSTNN
jgi:hypothetical protein